METTQYTLQAAQIFTIFFIMLGPMRLVGPFNLATVSLTQPEKQKLAIKTGAISLFALIIAGFVGSRILMKWQIQPATLVLAAGILFVIAALPPILSYPQETEKIQKASAQDLALQLLISPYGLAAVIVLFSVSQDLKRLFTIIGCLLAVLVVDVIFMAFTKSKPDAQTSLLMKILRAILATLQFSLALQLIIIGLRALGIIESV